MPIYDYKCNNCMSDFEEMVFGNTQPTCPHCLGTNTERLISMPRTCRKGNSAGDSFGSDAGSSSCAGCSGGSCSSCGS